MESQPLNPEFRNNPENFHPCISMKFEIFITKTKTKNEAFCSKQQTMSIVLIIDLKCQQL